MGTSNFHNVNATKVFAVLLNREDEETGETRYPEEWDYEDFYLYAIDRIDEHMKNAGFNITSAGGDPHGLRSYGSRGLTGAYIGKNHAGVEISVNIFSVLRSAYYEGASLDWFIQYEANCSTSVEEPFEPEDIQSEWEGGLSKRHAETAVKWMDSQRDKLIEALETVYGELAERRLNCLGHFSNGEAVYRDADD